jgi:FtsP/CotA-like multicopper oxidase with cupredoxin domain
VTVRKFLRPLALTLALTAPLVERGGAPAAADPAPLCAAGDTTGLRPSRDLYCLELIPRPDLSGTGMLELGRAESPFDVAVTDEGNQRYDASVSLSGLPDPKTLGDFTTYVAWVAPPSLDPMVNLGAVTNGRAHLGEIRFDKFLFFVTAETRADVKDRMGRLVLRGMSPSIRMQQHSMLVMTSNRDSMAGMDHSGHQMGGEGVVPPAMWFMPPARPKTPMVPMPGVDELVPPAKPYLPGVGVDPRKLPEAKPRSVVVLKDGDTIELEASLVRRTINGKTLVMYAYNGQYPGPLFRVDEGAAVTVHFVNAIDQPTAVHWHGIRLDNPNDGAPGVTQDPVPVGGKFTYRVKFPDAGIYWYHPHIREDIQQDLGLYGNILVKPKRPDAFGPANREETLIFDDLLLGDQGLVPYGQDKSTHVLMGRFGNQLLVNGEPSYRLAVGKGEVVRFYLTNVSNTRTFNLSVPGAKMKLVGADVGRYERESWVESAAIAPAQRYIVDVRFPEARTYPLMNQVQAIDHNIGAFFSEFDTLGTVTAAGASASPDYAAAFDRLRENRDVVAEIDRYRPWFAKKPDKELVLTLRLGDLPFGVLQMLRRDQMYAHPVEWSGTMPMMDWLTTTDQAAWVLRDPATGKENMAVDWKFKLGDVVKIRVANDRSSLHPMPHPIHLHGQRFLVLAYNDRPNPNLVWKDTILIPVGGTVDLLVEMSNPGKWMMHCHIAEHLEAGMMGVFEVR